MTDTPNTIGSAIGASLKRDPYRLDFVLMPLVTTLELEGLSWNQRQQVARAMLATMRHHKSMMDEANEACRPKQQTGLGSAS